MGNHSLPNRSKSDPETIAAWETLCWAAAIYHRLSKTKLDYNEDRFLSFSPSTMHKGKKSLYDADEEEGIDDAIQRHIWNPTILKSRASSIMISINQLISATKEMNPEPAAPKRPAVITVTAVNKSDDRRFHATFAAVFAARRLLDWLISDRKVKWLSDDTILIADKVQVTVSIGPSPDKDILSQIMEHEFTPKERAWELSPYYMRHAHQMFTAKEPDWTDNITPTTKPIAKDAPPAPATKTKPTKDSNLISLPALLADTDITPKEARVALRKLNTPKPTGRWEFNPTDAPALLADITKHVTKQRKK